MASKWKVCPKCGTKNDMEKQSGCPSCGTKIINGEYAAQQSVQRTGCTCPRFDLTGGIQKYLDDCPVHGNAANR